MQNYAVQLTETRYLWYYLEASDGDSALDEAHAIYAENRNSGHIFTEGGADTIEQEIVDGEAYELVQY